MNDEGMEHRLDEPLRDVLAVMQDRIMQRSTYFGVQAWKSPVDAWVYQEMVVALRPEWIIEIGVNAGGSTLMLAHLCDLLDHGQVIAVELRPERVDQRVRDHPRVTVLDGDALDHRDAIAAAVAGSTCTMVIEDSAHSFSNTLAVCRAFADLVTPDSYLIVEDGICHHGLDVGPDPGPYEAIEAFVAEDPRFEIDRGREDFLITWNPTGYLRRTR